MSKMEFTVLGNDGAYPSEDGACSGYLVRTTNTNLLLDCGSGIFSRLIKRIKLEDLHAIVLSHLHADHMSDILVLRYALMLNELPPLKVFMPETPETEAFLLKSSKEFDIQIINTNDVFEVGDLNLKFATMKHSITSFATKIVFSDMEIVYSGDTQYNEGLIEFATWCDLLVCDAAFNEDTYKNGAPHASAKQAALMAKEAKVAKLLLTHFAPGTDLENHLMEAKSEFKYTAVAVPNLTINI